jgi:Ca2+-binding RTX toxin-like protein
MYGGRGNDDIRATAIPGRGAPVQLANFHGGPGRDVLVGDLRTEQLAGGRGRDLLVGAHEFEWLRGGPGDDLIKGRRGDDVIVGGRGVDEILAGRGDDRVLLPDGEHDLVRCGPGLDRVSVDPLDVVRGCERVILEERG